MFNKSLIVVMFMFLSSCGSSSNTSNNISLSLDGTWRTDCSYISEDDEYCIEEFTFSDNYLEGEFKAYDNSSCSGDPIDSGEGYGTFTAGKAITLPSGEEVVEIDFEITMIGHSMEIPDIIRKSENEFNLGVSDVDDRPTEINEELTYIKQ